MTAKAAIGLALVALVATSPATAQRAKRAMGVAPIGNPSDWILPDDYPPDAVRAARQGRVVVAIEVDARGNAVACRIDTSSGTESLDSKACEVVLARAKFNPAIDRRGRPIRSTYKLPIRWTMPDVPANGVEVVDVAKTPASLTVETEFRIDPLGKVAGCSIVIREPSDSADPCIDWPVGRVWGTRYTKNGTPVAATVRLRFSRSVKIAP